LGIKEIRDQLLRIFSQAKIPQAFLFTGTRGIGKTSAARIIAKTVNCLKRGRDPEPCGQCDSCLAIQKGKAVDLIEIDAASNRGIDDIRQLKEKIDLMPVDLEHKVYIIDEVHMLTTEAFNALLKTLEEPPLHTVFVLCTTNPEKIPLTIISRCLRFDFRRAKKEEIVENLKQVAKKEKLKVETGVFELLTKTADGSFRDAQKALQQLASGRKEITLAQAQEFFGSFAGAGFIELIDGLVNRDSLQAFGSLGKMAEGNLDYDRLLRELLETLRQALLLQMEVIKGDQPTTVVKMASLTLIDLKSLINYFLNAAVQQKNTPVAGLPVELALVSWLNQEPSSPSSVRSPAGRAGKQGKEKSNLVEKNGGPIKPLDKSCWQKILSLVRPQNHSIEALLRSCRPLGCDEKTLTLEVFYRFHKEQLEIYQRREVVEKTISEVLGRPVRIRLVLGERPTVIEEETGEPEKTGVEDDFDVIIGQATKIFNDV